MGFIGLPVSLFLYWLFLHYKKNDPFPKGGLLRLLAAGTVSVILSVIFTLPIDFIVSFLRLGILSDPDRWMSILQSQDAELLRKALTEAQANIRPSFLWNLAGMFFSAGILEEGLKCLTCRIAIRKEGMIRTWMDSVAAFAITGITFEFLENIAFGAGADPLSALARALASAHFVFGVIMGYFYGKYRVTGRKKYRLLSFMVPVVYHTVTNALIRSVMISKTFEILGTGAAISHILAAAVTVILVLRWQKKGTLDVTVPSAQ